MAELLYFAWVREALGRDAEQLKLPPEVTTVGRLLDWLEARGDAVFADRARLRVAVNQAFAGGDTPVGDSDEIAIFPPVTGG